MFPSDVLVKDWNGFVDGGKDALRPLPLPVREREEKHESGAVADDEKGRVSLFSLEGKLGWLFSLTEPL